MERFFTRFAKSIGAQESPLFISVDRVTAWVWIPVPGEASDDVVNRLRAAADGPLLAVGNPLPGVDGFRHSHRQAQEARSGLEVALEEIGKINDVMQNIA